MQKLLNVVPGEPFENIRNKAKTLVAFLCEKIPVEESGYVLLGGHQMMTNELALELGMKNFIPVIAETERVVIEKEDGKKISIFRHKNFRVLKTGCFFTYGKVIKSFYEEDAK